jgi:hypothetical protein
MGNDRNNVRKKFDPSGKSESDNREMLSSEDSVVPRLINACCTLPSGKAKLPYDLLLSYPNPRKVLDAILALLSRSRDQVLSKRDALALSDDSLLTEPLVSLISQAPPLIEIKSIDRFKLFLLVFLRQMASVTVPKLFNLIIKTKVPMHHWRLLS